MIMSIIVVKGTCLSEQHIGKNHQTRNPRTLCGNQPRKKGIYSRNSWIFRYGMFIESTKPFPRLALESISPELYAFNIETWRQYQQSGKGLHPRILPMRRTKRERSDHLVVLFILPTGKGGRTCSLNTKFKTMKY